MQQPTNAVPAWIRFLVNRLIVPIAHHFNQHLRELEERNAELTQRVYKLEQLWVSFARAFQSPHVIEGSSEQGSREVTGALVRWVNTEVRPRPDPLTNPDPTERMGA